MVYLPPEAKDVSAFMADLITWLGKSSMEGLPCPLRAGIAHYQFATTHPYYDGNGRTARLLATLILYLGGFDLKGFYSLEEYYARDLPAYYNALAVGPSHNYYLGPANADITAWVEYFILGMAEAFENVQRRAKEEASPSKPDKTQLLRQLDARQRRVLQLFQKSDRITAAQVEKTLGLTGRTARHLCQRWVADEFLVIADPSKKARKYGLSKKFSGIFSG